MDPRGKELGRGTFDGRNIPIKNQMLRNFFEQYTAIAADDVPERSSYPLRRHLRSNWPRVSAGEVHDNYFVEDLKEDGIDSMKLKNATPVGKPTNDPYMFRVLLLLTALLMDFLSDCLWSKSQVAKPPPGSLTISSETSTGLL